LIFCLNNSCSIEDTNEGVQLKSKCKQRAKGDVSKGTNNGTLNNVIYYQEGSVKSFTTYSYKGDITGESYERTKQT